jgi:vitellogenic carboxypeptidase-like protein
MQENQNAQIKINLMGMAIGDGLCDPVTMTNYGDYLFEVGMIGYKERTHFEEVAKNARENIRQGNWRIASELFDELLDGDLTGAPSYFKNVTGSDYYFNFLQFQEPKEFNFYSKFLNLPEVRKAIHVGDKVFHNGTKVEKILFEDIMKSVKPWVEDILNAGYKVLLFNGQLDIIVGYPLTENFVRSLRWQHSTDFKEAPRQQWRIGTVTAGYVQEYQNLALVLVRNAGHMVPYDQPVLGFDLINRFTSNKPFGTNYRY